MHATIDPLDLTFDFRTAYGPTRRKRNALITLEREGILGYGEVLLVEPATDRYPLTRETLEQEIASGIHSPQTASGLSIACMDSHYRENGIALSQRCPAGLRSYRTVPITDDAQDAIIVLDGVLRHTPLVKVKVAADRTYCERLLPLLPSTAIIDANGSWTTGFAIETLPLIPSGTIVEQPFARPEPAWRSVRDLYAAHGVRIFADESFVSGADIARHGGMIDGVVVKLEKHGGLRATHGLLQYAKRRGLEVVLGCNLVSTLGVSAASLLAPYADYIDLDATLFLDAETDPFEGTRVEKDGRLVYSDKPGVANRK